MVSYLVYVSNVGESDASVTLEVDGISGLEVIGWDCESSSIVCPEPGLGPVSVILELPAGVAPAAVFAVTGVAMFDAQHVELRAMLTAAQGQIDTNPLDNLATHQIAVQGTLLRDGFEDLPPNRSLQSTNPLVDPHKHAGL